MKECLPQTHTATVLSILAVLEKEYVNVSNEISIHSFSFSKQISMNAFIVKTEHNWVYLKIAHLSLLLIPLLKYFIWSDYYLLRTGDIQYY